jgi:hypothetical protein
MLGILRLVADVVTSMPQMVLWSIETAINALIAGFAAAAATVLSLLPGLPTPPGPPSSGVLQWIAYIYPMGAMLAVVATFIALWIAFLAVRIPLRWVKAL